MKTKLYSLFVCAVCLFGSAWADLAPVKVTGSSKLQLAIVDAARQTRAREAIHAAFAASLSTAMAAEIGGAVDVQAKKLSADQAAFGLDAGSCHVVLAIGKTIPRPLVKSELERLNAKLGADKNEQHAYLVFSNVDEGLKKLLTKSFASAITDNRFLDALDGGIETPEDATKSKALAATGP